MKKNITILKFGKQRFHITLEEIIIMKLIIMIGFLAVYFLPVHLTIPVTVATNLLWLWRT